MSESNANLFSVKLKNLLLQDLKDLETLKNLLEGEQEAITKRDTTTIQRVTQDKASIVATLESRTKVKAKLIASSGLGIKPGQVEIGLKRLNDSELMTLWRKTKDYSNDCQHLNAVNGNVIARSLQRTNKLMQIIRGQTQTNHLYGQQGKEQSYGGTHRIGQA